MPQDWHLQTCVGVGPEPNVSSELCVWGEYFSDESASIPHQPNVSSELCV
jgi:hypothetical protein